MRRQWRSPFVAAQKAVRMACGCESLCSRRTHADSRSSTRQGSLHARPSPACAVCIPLGNGLSATVGGDGVGSSAAPALSSSGSRARRASRTAAVTPLVPTTTPATNTFTGLLTHDSPERALEVVRPLLDDLARFDALLDDHACYCDSSTGPNAREVRERLVNSALPLLFQVTPSVDLSSEAREGQSKQAAAATEAQRMEPHPCVGLAGDESRPGAFLSSAQETLACWLSILAQTATHTARRYEPAMPTALVAALWLHVMPMLHRAAMDTATPPSQKKTYRQLRRHLARRARDSITVLPPALAAHVLARVQQCGALSDDVLGPVATALLEEQSQRVRVGDSFGSAVSDPTTSSSRPAVHHTGSSTQLQRVVHTVAAADTQHLLFQGADAVTMMRVISRATTPEHFQLHTLVHTVLLPVVRQLLHEARQQIEHADQEKLATAGAVAWEASVPSQSALYDLTRVFVRYAVSGQAADDLTALWVHHHRHRHPHLVDGRVDDVSSAFRECGALLRLLSFPTPPPTSRDRRTGTQEAAAEAYLPLAEHLCAWVVRLGHAHIARGAAPVELSAALDVVTGLLGVDSMRWVEAYAVAATLAVNALVARLESAPPDAALEARLRSTLRALRARRGPVPDQPLHMLCVRVLLHSATAEVDVEVAASALVTLGAVTSASTTEAVASEKTEPHDAPLPGDQVSTDVMGGDVLAGTVTADAERVLLLLRTHGPQLPAVAFAVAVTRAPLSRLSVAEQSRLLQHLADTATALPPSWLARAVVACAENLPSAVLDPISVQKLCSRFTVRSVVRRLPLAETSALLSRVVARDSATRANNALAMDALVRHVGVRLRHDVDGPTHTQLQVLMDLPHVVHALQHAHSFFIHLFSRACRVLLGQVEHAPWPVLLPAFAALADEYARRPPAQSRATVFPDVWELLRDRVLEAATTHTPLAEEAAVDGRDSMALDDVLAALNAFAALDVQDAPLFSSLAYALAHRCAQSLVSPNTQSAIDFSVSETVVHDVHLPEDASEAQRAETLTTQSRARLGQHVVSSLTPSAVAALTTTLLTIVHHTATAREAGGVDELAEMHGTLLMWMLVNLRQRAHDLYPIDVVLVMASLARFAGESVAARETTPLMGALAHRAYDACRSMFLFMFGSPEDAREPHPKAPATAGKDDDKVQADEATDEPMNDRVRAQLAAQRAEWPAKALASIRAVPHPLFAHVLSEVTTSGWLDEAVALACAQRLCTRRVCREALTSQQLVDVAMSLSVQLSDTAGRVGNAASEATQDATAGTNAVVLPTSSDARRFLTEVLNALWDRTDELSVSQIDALVRFLRHQYASKLDQDFVDRLTTQREMLLAGARAGQRMRKDGDVVASAPLSHPRGVGDMSAPHPAGQTAEGLAAETLFDIM